MDRRVKHINVTAPKAQLVSLGTLCTGSVFTTTDPLSTYMVLGDAYHGIVPAFNFDRGRSTELLMSEQVTPAKITAMNVTLVTLVTA